jgi:DUF1680 family protein
MQIAPLPPDRRLVPVPATHVRLRDEAFFTPWFRRNLETTLFHGHEQLEKNGQFRNFRLAAATLHGGKAEGDYSGVHFYDSDAYKWLEAASLALAYGPNPKLEALVDRFVDEIAAAQEPDGYLQTQYTFMKGKVGKDGKTFERWSHLPDDHELYCAGHLIQAAIAHHEVTGRTTLYDVALKLANCLDSTFGPGKRTGCCGHPEVETALVQLWRHSGEKRWLELAKFFLEERGQKPPRAGGDFYRQDDRPIREQKVAAGHAVRQLYLCSGVAGVAAETNDRGLYDAALAISQDVDACKLYVTGGVGARHDGEAFGKAFELPNESAYAETCASIALMRFSREMLALTGERSFADRLENTLYNAFLASIGEDGKSFFYVNPLESSGGRQRQPWYWCACCPPNVMRTLAGLPGWFASTTSDTLWLHLYDDVDVATKLGDGREVGVRVETQYPWDGAIVVTVTKAPETPFAIALRLPPSLRGDLTTRVEDEQGRVLTPHDKHAPFTVRDQGGWFHFRGPFRVGTKVRLAGSLAIEPVVADPRVDSDVGKVALRRGPLVFAFESTDQPDVDLFRTALDVESPDVAYERAGDVAPLGLVVRGVETSAPAGDETLYHDTPASSFRSRAVRLHARPYYAWANRGDSKMRIWMPVLATAAAAAPAPIAPAAEPQQSPYSQEPESTFSGDVKFLGDHADVVVLQAHASGPVAVSPRLSGRVMTSAFATDEVGFGLVNRPAIEKPPVERGFNNSGGEDRLWLSPEGGPYGLYFDPGAKQELANWYVPLSIDGRARTVVTQDSSSILFKDVVELVNVQNVKMRLEVTRKVTALSKDEIASALGLPSVPEGVHVVGFTTRNTVVPASATPLPENAVVGAWILGQFKPSPTTNVLMPFDGKPEVIKKDYFGVVPEDRLSMKLVPGTNGGVARFKADSLKRSKIGVSPAGATGWLGAYDSSRGVLTLVHHDVAAADAAVPDCNWVVPNPRALKGDVATSYNHHGEDSKFFELESLSAALTHEKNANLTHIHTTIHVGGDPGVMAKIAKNLLRSEL